MTGLFTSIFQHGTDFLQRGSSKILAPPEAPPQPSSAITEAILRSGRSLKRRVWAYSATFTLTILILAITLIVEQKRLAVEEVQSNASNLSAAFELEVRGYINNTWAALKRIEAGIAAKGPKQALADWLKHRAPDFRHTNITILDAKGNVVSSTVAPNWTGADLSDRKYFKIHKANPDAGFYIGVPVMGRGSQHIKIPMSIRLNQPNGAFAGILVATVEPEFLTVLYHSVNLGRTGTLMLVGTDGAVRAYLSRNTKGDGSQATAREDGSGDGSELPALRAAAFESKGSYEDNAAADGIPRLYNWRKVEGFPLLVIVGLGEAEVLAASAWQKKVAIAACTMAILFSLLMPLLLSREISKRISHEIELNSEKAHLTLANSALEEERRALHALNMQYRQVVQRAEEANRAKSGFLAYMSHEFRTPMHAILAYTKMAQEDIRSEDPAKIEKYIENARTAGLRLLDLLNNLLDFAKLEAGKIKLQTGKANLLDIIEGSQRELNSLMEEKRLRVSIATKSNDTGAVVDYARITQVLINLFSNAIKFSPVGGRILVEISDAELSDGRPALQCSFCDQGTGIPEHELSTIFDRFSQGSSSKKSSGGTGLGLTICRELISLHGGKIWASNRPEGGAVFSFTVPRGIPENEPASINGTAQNLSV
jgi:signal transduction histidine kinase